LEAGRAADRMKRRRWARVRRATLIVVLVALVPVAWSYATTMLRPSNLSLGVRSVEWVRDHGFAWLVSDVESAYYSMTAPDKGGPGLHRLPALGVAAQPAARARARKRAYAPPAVRPVLRPALPGEGVWRPAGRSLRGAPPVRLAEFRPLPDYPSTVAGLAWIDTTRTRVALYPGRYEPPTSGPRGPLEIPVGRRHRVVAAFNGGFKMKDINGGFFANGHVFEPLVDGIGTVVGYASGRVDVERWRGGPHPPPGVVFARQNLPLIVDAGRPNPNLNDGPQWGATLGNAVRVWRTGLGVDRRGDLIYAAADNQTVQTLAAILIRAHAVRAIELDINPYWVSFISYGAPGGRRPAKLLDGIQRPVDRYLSPDDRDFFAVYGR